MSINFKLFQNFPELKYGLSEKSDGPMELAETSEALRTNRCKFFSGLGIGESSTVRLRQIHSVKNIKADLNKAGEAVLNADGLFTDEPGIFLTISVADCFPIYFYNPILKLVGLVHSGWRGTVGNISAKMIKSMGCSPEDLIVGIGPGIQLCHFEIQTDILENFSNYQESIVNRNNHIFVDLPKIIMRQLDEAGVPEKNIESSGVCTFCQKDQYFSYRRDKPKEVEAMIAYIGIA